MEAYLRLLSGSHQVTAIIRKPEQSETISEAGATPRILSLEQNSVTDFTKAFEETKADVVYFSAGAGGNGGEERTKAVDYEGALKVFDAIEGVQGTKPRLILVSAVDIRDENQIPEHYVSLFLQFISLVARLKGMSERRRPRNV